MAPRTFPAVAFLTVISLVMTACTELRVAPRHASMDEFPVRLMMIIRPDPGCQLRMTQPAIGIICLCQAGMVTVQAVLHAGVIDVTKPPSQVDIPVTGNASNLHVIFMVEDRICIIRSGTAAGMPGCRISMTHQAILAWLPVFIGLNMTVHA